MTFVGWAHRLRTAKRRVARLFKVENLRVKDGPPGLVLTFWHDDGLGGEFVKIEVEPAEWREMVRRVEGGINDHSIQRDGV